MGVGPTAALAVDVGGIGVRETLEGGFASDCFIGSAAGFFDVAVEAFVPFDPVMAVKSKPSMAALAASTPAAIAAKSTTIEEAPAVEADSLSTLAALFPEKDMEASDRDARDKDAMESNLGLPFC